MEATRRRKRDSVINQLIKNPFEFGFYQLMNVLTLLFPNYFGENLEIGDRINFSANVRLDFPASDVEALELPQEDRDLLIVKTNFLNMAGINGPLPHPYTDLIMQRSRRKDTAFKDFLDIFNHRCIQLMYDLQRKYKVIFGYRLSHQNVFSQYFRSFCGLGTSYLSDRLKVNDRSLYYYTSIFIHQKRSALGLQILLAHFFNVSVRIHQFMGSWFSLDPDQFTLIGTQGQNHRLGDATILGTKVWLQDKKFRITLGPLALEKFEEFLPPWGGYKKLCDLVRFYCNDDFEFDIELILNKEQIPDYVLGYFSLTFLGWTSMIGGKKDHIHCILQSDITFN